MKLNPAFTNYDGLEDTFGDSDCISFDGSIVTATVVPGKVLLPIYLSPYSHNQYSVTLLHGDVQSISMGLR